MTVFGETITRLRRTAGADDRHGNPTYTWAETEIPGAAFAPERASAEVAEVGRVTLTEKPALYFRDWPDITAEDRVRVRGELFEVDGVPSDWRSPWGSGLGGLVVILRRQEASDG